ncbi:hypothetical protein ACKWMZ_26825 [Pseudomonas protegens]|uniref:hypothetical protein n=1 Tax=Pseudomonas protegens TaxID=380021 RepID=UPI003966CA44
MPPDAASAMALARKNFNYLAEAKDQEHLEKLRKGAAGYNQSLMKAGWINQEQVDELSLELDSAYDKCSNALSSDE